MYCETRLWWVLTPNASSSAFSACGDTGPRNLPIIASAGLPGMSRGRKKLRVSAAHMVSAKKPRRRSRNLMSSSSWPSSSAIPAHLAPLAHTRDIRSLSCSPAPGGAPVRPRGGTRRGRHPLLLRCQVEEHLAPVRVVVGGRLGVRVALSDPSGEGARVVLVPVDLLGDRDHRHLLQHHSLQLVDDGVLRSGTGRAAVGVDQRVRGRAAVALPVRSGWLPDRG